MCIHTWNVNIDFLDAFHTQSVASHVTVPFRKMQNGVEWFCCATVSHSSAPHKAEISMTSMRLWVQFHSNAFFWWPQCIWLGILKSVVFWNLRPRQSHVYLSFCVARNCGWWWHNENHLTQFHIPLKGAVSTVNILNTAYPFRPKFYPP